MTFGLFPNPKKESIKSVVDLIIQYLMERQVGIVLPADTAEKMGYPHLGRPRESMFHEIACGITIGGDGTLLSAARQAAVYGIPICGVNMGQLGFLTAIELPELNQALERLIGGKYYVEERLMLDAAVIRSGEILCSATALNDVVVTKGGFARMIRLNLYIDGLLTANYPADGLIMATSTGSTGYSLSAGGPIVNPSLKVIILTPICPHTLYSRSLLVSEEEEIKVTVQATHNDVFLTVDGQTMQQLRPEDTVIVRRSPYCANFIHFGHKSYYETVYTKLTAGR